MDALIFLADWLREQAAEVLCTVQEDDPQGRQLLSRPVLMALHGFWEQWPTCSMTATALPCDKHINSARGGALPACAFGAEWCGKSRWCAPCTALYASSDLVVHPHLLVDALVTLMEETLMPPSSAPPGEEPRCP